MRVSHQACRVVVDTNFLIAWKGSVSDANVRAAATRFIARFTSNPRNQLVIPAPVIAEFLVKADINALSTLDALINESWVAVGVFDYNAALELHLIERAASFLGDKKDGIDAPWQKIKFDRQIVAISRSYQCELIVTNDRGVAATALRSGIPVCPMAALDKAEALMRRQHAVREPGSFWYAASQPWLPSSATSQSRNTAVSSREAASREMAR